MSPLPEHLNTDPPGLVTEKVSDPLEELRDAFLDLLSRGYKGRSQKTHGSSEDLSCTLARIAFALFDLRRATGRSYVDLLGDPSSFGKDPVSDIEPLKAFAASLALQADCMISLAAEFRKEYGTPSPASIAEHWTFLDHYRQPQLVRLPAAACTIFRWDGRDERAVMGDPFASSRDPLEVQLEAMVRLIAYIEVSHPTFLGYAPIILPGPGADELAAVYRCLETTCLEWLVELYVQVWTEERPELEGGNA